MPRPTPTAILDGVFASFEAEPSFVAATSWQGPRSGYYFSRGPSGVG